MQTIPAFDLLASRFHRAVFVTALAFAGAFGCGDDGSGAGDPILDAGAFECLDDPSLMLEGAAVPLSAVAFRNAFDPTDPAIYDPDDPEALPGPVMVDTWGDRSTGPHGTLGVFPPGFQAPLHTHTAGYYGVVLRGEMTNPFGTDLEAFLGEGPDDEPVGPVLVPGSFWHVPAGSQHTTTCVGPEVCWFYFHAEDAFDFAPLVDETGALLPGVTLDALDPDAIQQTADEADFMGEPGSFVRFAAGFGDMGSGEHGTFGIFDAGAASPPHVHGATYYGVVIAGALTNPFNLAEASPVLGRGGTWSVPADSVHVTACEPGIDCLFYFHSRQAFDFVPLCE